MKKFVLLLLIFVILFSGCVSTSEETDSETIGETAEETAVSDTETTTESETVLIADSMKLEVPHVYSGATLLTEDNESWYEARALSYLGSFAMLTLYDDSSLQFYDVIAHSGVGSNAKYDKRMGLYNNFRERSIIEAADNLGYDIHMVLREKGLARSKILDYNFENSTANIIYVADADEALHQLKLAISNKNPVEVNVDAFYLETTFANQSSFWEENKDGTHFSHFFVVSGYDSEFIYLQDPNEPGSKELKAPVVEFLTAWKNGATSGVSGAHLGPFWMISLKNNGDRKSLSQILSWNKQLSLRAVNHIRNTKTIADFGDLGVGRREFANYLREHGSTNAADLYDEVAVSYFSHPDKTVIQRIAGNEQIARAKMH
ncbi:MAG: hypothetical protein QF475_00035 [Candidatus Undinarchaeales archaeon]|jgi:hypothetical protein|nr:hypothetical protein [Candidatus Undinarchaeales archaeon]